MHKEGNDGNLIRKRQKNAYPEDSGACKLDARAYDN